MVMDSKCEGYCVQLHSDLGLGIVPGFEVLERNTAVRTVPFGIL